jgi:sugar lactone lactonase YvrE
VLISSVLLLGCGGGGGGSGSQAAPLTYTVGGSVSGLTGAGLVLLDNGADGLNLPANGSFHFATPLASGASYLVTVSADPTGGIQTCVVTNASGTVVSSPIEDVTVTCMASGISLLAGQLGGPGNIDGPVASARFDGASLTALTIAPSGVIYLADIFGAVIRSVSIDGMVSTVAGTRGVIGNVDGTGPAAQFRSPSGITADPAGNIFITDEAAYVVREMTAAGNVTTFAGMPGIQGAADGTGSSASFSEPFAISTNATGELYIDDSFSLRLISPGAAVTTLQAPLGDTYDIAVDGLGTVYFTDQNGFVSVRSPSGLVSILAGSNTPGSRDGTGAAAQFNTPTGIAMNANGGVYVADTLNDTVRVVTPGGVVTTLAGQPGMSGTADGTGNEARFDWPGALSSDTSGNVYVGDGNNGTIRKITPSGVVTTIAGVPANPGLANGTGAAAQFFLPEAVAMDRAGNTYVADSGNNVIRKISFTGVTTTLAGSGTPGFVDGGPALAEFNYPLGITVDSAGNVYVADTNNFSLRKITPAGVVTTLAGNGSPGVGDGPGTVAQFAYPCGMAIDASGNLYVADQRWYAVRMITPAGVVSTIAGGSAYPGYVDGPGAQALFNNPQALAIDAFGNLYVADSGNNVIRKITPSFVVSTLAGNVPRLGYMDGQGSAALFNNPTGITADDAGHVYVGDQGNDVIREVTPDGLVTTVVGVHLSKGVQLGALPGSLTTAAGLGLAMVPHSSRSMIVADAAENAVVMINFQ